MKRPTKRDLEAKIRFYSDELSKANREKNQALLDLGLAQREVYRLKVELHRIASVRVERRPETPNILTVAYQVTDHELKASREPSVIFDYMHRLMTAELTRKIGLPANDT
jgi:hypothetical protein